MTRSIKIFWLLGIVALSVSCSPKLVEGNGDKLPKLKDTDLISALDSLAHVKIDYFYSKISTKYKDSSQNVSFKTSLRMTNDSAVNMMMTFAKIPVLNSIVTKDSVKISNRRDKCYIKQQLSYIKKSFGVDFSFRNLEELLLGLPVGFDAEHKYFQVNDPYSYSLTSHRKRDIKRNERKDEREIITQYTLSNDLKRLKSMMIESPEDTTTIFIEHIERQVIDGMVVPSEVNVTATGPRQEIRVFLEYHRVRLNEREKIHFVIPESYEECE